MVIGGCRWLWVVVGGCGWLQVVLGGLRWFLVVVGGCGWSQVVVGGRRWLQVVVCGCRWSYVVVGGRMWLQVVVGCCGWFQVVVGRCRWLLVVMVVSVCSLLLIYFYFYGNSNGISRQNSHKKFSFTKSCYCILFHPVLYGDIIIEHQDLFGLPLCFFYQDFHQHLIFIIKINCRFPKTFMFILNLIIRIFIINISLFLTSQI